MPLSWSGLEYLAFPAGFAALLMAASTGSLRWAVLSLVLLSLWLVLYLFTLFPRLYGRASLWLEGGLHRAIAGSADVFEVGGCGSVSRDNQPPELAIAAFADTGEFEAIAPAIPSSVFADRHYSPAANSTGGSAAAKDAVKLLMQVQA